MGKAYTKAVIEACEHVDQFIDVDHFLHQNITLAGNAPDCILHVFPVAKIAKRAKELKIPLRIGTTNRLYHWFTCNQLVKLSRSQSELHEAQMNLRLLSAFGIKTSYKLPEIQNMFGFTNILPLQSPFTKLIHQNQYNLILHPKSQGSAREWGLENFIQLIHLLDTNQIQHFHFRNRKRKGFIAAFVRCCRR